MITLEQHGANQRAVMSVEMAANVKVLLGADPATRYKQLKRMIHPDRFAGNAEWVRRAEAANQKLDEEFYKMVPGSKPASPVRIGAWVVTGPLTKGDIADLHRVEAIDKPHEGVAAVLKIAQAPCDNDLIRNEREILQHLHLPKERGSVTLAHYAPKLLDGFTASGRAANVLSAADGFVSLAEICAFFPTLDARHIVWMMNRALSALGYVHLQGVIHGAITPKHLLYNPGNHDMCLVDWCYGVRGGGRIKAIASEYERNYPPEVMRKLQPAAGTDLYMAAYALYDVAEGLPKSLRTLLDLCLAKSLASRPDDVWAFQDRWRKAAEKEYGPPKFVALELPVN